MEKFRFRAKDITGQVREVEIEAETEDAAERKLKLQGFNELSSADTESSTATDPRSRTVRKLFLALSLALLLVGAIAVLRYHTRPPDMPELFARWDQSSIDETPEVWFECLADNIMLTSSKGEVSRVTREELLASFKESRSEELKTYARISSNTEVLKEGWKEGDYWVLVRCSANLVRSTDKSDRAFFSKVLGWHR